MLQRFRSLLDDVVEATKETGRPTLRCVVAFCAVLTTFYRETITRKLCCSCWRNVAYKVDIGTVRGLVVST